MSEVIDIEKKDFKIGQKVYLKIVEQSNAANTEKYLKFHGISTRSIRVSYIHKSVK